MRLFHGTTGETARRVAEGATLVPGQPSHWPEWQKSNAECVYLTTTFALSYAAHAAHDRTNEWGIIEVDPTLLDSRKMLPDEDWIVFTQLGRDASQLGNARDNLRRWGSMWMKSLDQYGCVAHLGYVPRHAIARVVVGQALPEYDKVAATVEEFAKSGSHHRLSTYRFLEAHGSRTIFGKLGA